MHVRLAGKKRVHMHRVAGSTASTAMVLVIGDH
jgi:hypothetical protein